MDQKTFESEIAMCQVLTKKHGGKCNWGQCDKCGVVPLLYKLGKDEFYDDPVDVEHLRKIVLS